MAWYTHAPTFADPETGAFSEDFQGLASNFKSMADGDPGAPPIMLAALPRLVAGNAVRAVVSNGASLPDSGSLTAGVSIGIMQFGTFRVVQTFGGTASARNNIITRKRAGVDTVLLGPTTTNPATVDLDCLPGDLFTFEATGSSGSGGANLTISASIRTNNVDLYPGQGLWGLIQGNSAAP